MSIRTQLGASLSELRLKQGEEPLFSGEGPVVQEKLSVEEAQAAAWKKIRRSEEMYESVGEYDPVLCSHCRLDRER